MMPWNFKLPFQQAVTCLPEGNQAHDGPCHGLPQEGIDDGVESCGVTEIDIAKTPLQVY